jgi:hypothetical protein
MNCPSCGAALQETARFCGSCGQIFRDTRAPDVGQPQSSSSSSNEAPRVAVRHAAGLGVGDLWSATLEASRPQLGALVIGSILLCLALVFAICTIIGWFALPALASGYVVVALRVVAGKPIALRDFFKGLQLFVPMMLLGIVAGLLSQIGFYLFFVPGLYLTLIWSLAPFVMVDRGLDFWPSMEMSREVVHAHLGEVGLFTALAFVINVVATLPTIGLAVIVTIPVTTVGYAVLYDRLIGIQGGADKL